MFSWWWGIKEKENGAVGAVDTRGRAQVVTHVYTTSLQDIYSDYRRSYTCQLTCARMRCLPAALEDPEGEVEGAARSDCCEVTLRVLTLQASAHEQPVVPAEARGRARARC